MPLPRWKGSRAIQLQPGYPDYKANNSGETVTLVYGGPYKDLLSYKPVISQIVTGFPYIPVAEVNVKPLGAGVEGPGTLTIILQQDSGATTSSIVDQTDEVDWSELQRPIERHPRYNGSGPSSFAGAQITDDVTFEGDTNPTPVAELWDQLKNSPSVTASKTLLGKVYDEDAGVYYLLKDLQKKFKAGTTDYVAPAPVTRRTTRSFTKPTGVTQGKIQTPPSFDGLPDGYVWLKSADRTLRQGKRGKWERVQEWTGADKWDTDLYSNA